VTVPLVVKIKLLSLGVSGLLTPCMRWSCLHVWQFSLELHVDHCVTKLQSV